MVRRAHGVGFAILLVCLVGIVGAASGLLTPDAAAQSRDTVEQVGQVSSAPGEFTRTTFVFEVYDNGSVRWTTRYARQLNESETDDFESFAATFNSTETDLYRDFRTQAESLARTTNETTDRTVRATQFAREAFIDRRGTLDPVPFGTVEMGFTWTNVSRVSDQQVVLGTVFEGGLYLGAGQKLVVKPGPDLTFDRPFPDPDSQSNPSSLADSDSITWLGGEDGRAFNDERPRIEFVPASSSTTPGQTTTPGLTETPDPTTPPGQTTTPGPTTSQQGTSGGGGAAFPSLAVLLVVLVLGVGTVGIWYMTRVRDDDATDSGSVTSSTPPGDAGSTATPPSTETQGESQIGDDQLLSDTDRVQSLLEDNGGRMRQSAIVEQTQWSKSKVSMLLSDMEDDDEITKLRVGRENIISLPGKEPDAAGSPFEDETDE